MESIGCDQCQQLKSKIINIEVYVDNLNKINTQQEILIKKLETKIDDCENKIENLMELFAESKKLLDRMRETMISSNYECTNNNCTKQGWTNCGSCDKITCVSCVSICTECRIKQCHMCMTGTYKSYICLKCYGEWKKMSP